MRVGVLFQPGRHLPLPLSGDVLHQGIDPTCVSWTIAYFWTLIVSPLLTPASVSTSVLTQDSTFEPRDQVPKALLSQIGQGGIPRVHAQLKLKHARDSSGSLRVG